MPTINSKCVIKEMVKRGGRYQHGPQALAIFEYTAGVTGPRRWFIAFDPTDLAELQADPTARNVRQLWCRPGGTIPCALRSSGTSTTP